MTHYWFISTKYREQSRLALFTCLLAFVVILLGAYTRLTDAGLSCPDWPNCYGQMIAPHTAEQIQSAQLKYPTMPVNIKKAWTEMTHRYVAGTEGILILILAFTILARYKPQTTKSNAIAYSLIFLLAVQVMLGMLTVTEKLKPIIVLMHLVTGLSILSVLWWAYLDLPLKNESFVVKRLPSTAVKWFRLAVMVIALQITLGGWVSTHYAGLACVDFPYCNGTLLPNIQFNKLNTDLISIHMLHRIGAMITGIYFIFFSVFLLRQRSFKLLGSLLLLLLCTQISLGILNIVWLRPVWIALMHQAVGILLLLTTITALVKAHYEAMDFYYGN